MTNVVIIGGGPGGYEAALVAAQLGANVTLVERTGLGGAAVLTDCVPSKTLIATAEVMTAIQNAGQLGLKIHASEDDLSSVVKVDLGAVNQRVLDLAAAQSESISAQLERAGVTVLNGTARLDGPTTVLVTSNHDEEALAADIVLLATGTTPRELDTARCDGERILNWKQVYNLTELPEKLIALRPVSPRESARLLVIRPGRWWTCSRPCWASR